MTHVLLGAPHTWKPCPYEDPTTLELAPGPVWSTSDPDLVVAMDAEGKPWALERRCPHAGADLCRSARPGPRPGQLTCVHRRYLLDIAAGHLIDTVSGLPVRRLRSYVVIIEDGIAWATGVKDGAPVE